jgi:hypothetical protein
MILDLKKLQKNKIEVKKIMSNFTAKPQIDIILREYIPYQGNCGYSGCFKPVIKELAVKALKNKETEIIKIIKEGIFEILEDDGCGIHEHV